jgi:hypothetical protein
MSPNEVEFIGVLSAGLSTISTPIIRPWKLELIYLSQISDNEISSTGGGGGEWKGRWEFVFVISPAFI